MTTLSPTAVRRPKHPRNAYRFVFEALHKTQEDLKKPQQTSDNEDDVHISGQELLEGIRKLAIKQFGLMTRTVFEQWGIRSTDDFGHLVFELIERGDMRKTDRDSLSDFFGVYDFEAVFDRNYHIDTARAFH